MFPSEFQIGDRTVGGDHPAYVIAEVGANHNRDLGTAYKLIEDAAYAGADAVKFQSYAGSLYSRKAASFRYLKTSLFPSEFMESIAMPREWQSILSEYSRELGICFFSSPFDHDAVRQLAEIGVPVLKIASYEIVNLPLIEASAATGLPLLISTGMATMGEIEDALVAADAAPAVGLMQCTSAYSADLADANLRAMETMRRAFGVPVGLSDHTLGITVSIAAAALGASFIEKHLTLDRKMAGPDHSFALEPLEFELMVTGIRQAEAALGDGRKRGPSPDELEESYSLRPSLHFARDLPRGTVLERDMLTVKRPADGIKAKHLGTVVGRELTQDVETDDALTWGML